MICTELERLRFFIFFPPSWSIVVCCCCDLPRRGVSVCTTFATTLLQSIFVIWRQIGVSEQSRRTFATSALTRLTFSGAAPAQEISHCSLIALGAETGWRAGRTLRVVSLHPGWCMQQRCGAADRSLRYLSHQLRPAYLWRCKPANMFHSQGSADDGWRAWWIPPAGRVRATTL